MENFKVLVLVLLTGFSVFSAASVEWSIVQPANQGTSDVKSANADKLDGYQPSGLTWTILGIAKDDVSKSNVGLGNVMNINQSNLAGEGLDWDSSASELETGIDCPSGYIAVPGSNKYGIEDFCVMKFEAKSNGSGNPVSTATDSVWVSITQYDAQRQCRQLGDGYHLITEREWMTIAENVMRQPSNWADGTIGSKASNNGGLYLGNVAPPSSHSHLGYDAATDPDTRAVSNRPNSARLVLSNGNYIWDFSGNVWEWTDRVLYALNGKHESPQQDGSAGNEAWNEYDHITNFRGLKYGAPPRRKWNSSQGIGRIYLNGGNTYGADGEVYEYSAVLRGGGWTNGPYAGVLSAHLNGAPSRTHSNVGFRCSKTP